jgi:hypothetical protein
MKNSNSISSLPSFNHVAVNAIRQSIVEHSNQNSIIQTPSLYKLLTKSIQEFSNELLRIQKQKLFIGIFFLIIGFVFCLNPVFQIFPTESPDIKPLLARALLDLILKYSPFLGITLLCVASAFFAAHITIKRELPKLLSPASDVVSLEELKGYLDISPANKKTVGSIDFSRGILAVHVAYILHLEDVAAQSVLRENKEIERSYNTTLEREIISQLQNS